MRKPYRKIYSLRNRFFNGFKKVSTGCWEWQKAINRTGYGSIGDQWPSRKQRSTHRVSWEIHKGKIAKGKLVLHKCDNRKCVNPEHLYIGTYFDNNRDTVMRGRSNHLIGEKSPKSILTEKEVIEILKSYIPRKISRGFLAKKYGVSRSNIQNIIERRNWKHIIL